MMGTLQPTTLNFPGFITSLRQVARIKSRLARILMEQTRGIGSSRKSNFVNRSMYPTNRILCRFLLLLDDLSFLNR